MIALFKPVKESEESWQKSQMAIGLLLPKEYKEEWKRQRVTKGEKWEYEEVMDNEKGWMTGSSSTVEEY